MKARILINRGGGSAGRRTKVERALAGAGIAGEVDWLDGKEIAAAAKQAVEDGFGLVVAGGGDGTMSAVAGALAGTGAKLGILPLGTLNHFARDLKIPLGLGEAARLIASGKARAVDVAEVNGHIFVNNSAVGLYPLMVIDRESQESRLGRAKRPAMLVASLRALFRFSSERLTLTVQGRKTRLDTPLLFVGNNAYRLEMPDAGRRERLDRGELFVLVLRGTSRLRFFLAGLRALAGRSLRGDAVQIDEVRALRVDSRRTRLAVSLDGETALLKTPLDYKLRPKALKVIAP